VKPPRLIGPALSAIRTAAEAGPTAALLKGVLSESLGLDKLRAVPAYQRLALPMSNEPVVARSERSLSDAGLAAHPSPRPRPSMRARRAASSVSGRPTTHSSWSCPR
jgi:hypothetical protein